jgi:hypothetical protein
MKTQYLPKYSRECISLNVINCMQKIIQYNKKKNYISIIYEHHTGKQLSKLIYTFVEQ